MRLGPAARQRITRVGLDGRCCRIGIGFFPVSAHVLESGRQARQLLPVATFEEVDMLTLNDVQDAMRVWDEAHAAVHDYFGNNDILDPHCRMGWQDLVETENLARTQALTAVNSYRGQEQAK